MCVAAVAGTEGHDESIVLLAANIPTYHSVNYRKRGKTMPPSHCCSSRPAPAPRPPLVPLCASLNLCAEEGRRGKKKSPLDKRPEK